MPLNMPTRVNRVPRLGQPAGGPFPQARTPQQANPFPYEHDYGTGNSRGFDVSMQNLRDRQRAANSLLQANIGARGYGGIGGMTQEAAASQTAMIDPLIAANRQQQAQNGYSQWDRDRLRLGTAPVMDAAAPQPPGAQQVLGREVAPYGSVPASGQRSVSFGPIDDRAANIARRQKLAFDQLMARRSAMMTGQPLRDKFKTATTQTAQQQPQSTYAPPPGADSVRQVPAWDSPVSPFDLPGRQPPRGRQTVPNNFWGSLQSMLYGR